MEPVTRPLCHCIGDMYKRQLITKEIWMLEGLSDADLALDKEKDVSQTGFIVYFMGIRVALQSQGQ